MTKNRQSNFELLRLLCMVLVVAGHANYLVLDSITGEYFINNPLQSTVRVFLYQLSVVAVDVFVFISGWFEIKASIKGSRIMIQSLEYGLGIALLFCVINGGGISLRQIYNLCFIGNTYWFIIAYMILYILSPYLNSFAQNSDKSSLRKIVISYFLFEFVFGWLGGTGSFADGYSAISFIGIYILAQYLRRFPILIKHPVACFIGIALIATSIITCSLYILPQSVSYSIHRLLVAYNSPTVLAASICLFFSFEKIILTSRLINWMATSALSIYLIHLHPCVFDNLFSPVIYYLANMPNIAIPSILLFIIALCVLCVLVDKLRINIESLLIKLIRRIQGILFSNALDKH